MRLVMGVEQNWSIEKKVINSRETDAVVFYHDRLEEGFEAYCCTRWFLVTTACPTTNKTTNDEAQEEAQEEGVDENDLHLITRDNITADDRDLVNSGIEVDDDNSPAPENIPRAQDRNLNSIWEEGWRDSCIFPRRTAGAGHFSARLLRHHRDLKLSRLQVFEIMFLIAWVKDCLIPETNKYLKSPLSYGEYLQFIGISLEMSSEIGFGRRDWWRAQVFDEGEEKDFRRETPMKFNAIMSRNRYDDILSNLLLASYIPPNYTDKFWEIRQMIAVWNQNMRHEFQSSWICCLDESMFKWVNKYSCPGFMCVPRKPWPFGNEYHIICCSETNIMFHMEQVEGKNEPRQRHKPWSEKGKTVSLVLQMTESLHGSGTVVIKDSGFAVAEAEAELAILGCYGFFVAKMRRYRPKHVSGAEIQAFFQNLEPGTVVIRKGNLNWFDIFLHCVKEPDYVAIYVNSYGPTSRGGKDRTRKF